MAMTDADRDGLVQRAQAALSAIMPSLQSAIDEQRQVLSHALSESNLHEADIFAAAHQIRGIGATLGRPALGRLADVIATYITECEDRRVGVCPVSLRLLATALERSLDYADADTILAETIVAANALIRRILQKAAVGVS